MGRSLFIDNIDGTIRPKTYGQMMLYHLWKSLETLPNNALKQMIEGVEIEIPRDLMTKYIENADLTNLKPDKLRGLLRKEFLNSFYSPVKMSHVAMIKTYHRNKNDNYIFSEPLTKTLMRTKANVTMDILPDEPFCYYMELPGLCDDDGTVIKGIFISVIHLRNNLKRLEIIYYTPINEKNISNYIKHWLKTSQGSNLDSSTIDLMHKLGTSYMATNYINDCKTIEVKAITIPYTDKDLNRKLEDVLSDAAIDYVNKRMGSENPSTDLVGLVDSVKKDRTFFTIINALLYILSGEEHLDVERNEFSKKKKKQQAQSQIYTSKDFYVLGKNVKFLREYEQDGYYWAPFFRKKANSGDGKKTVFVKGHFKYFKNKEKYT